MLTSKFIPSANNMPNICSQISWKTSLIVVSRTYGSLAMNWLSLQHVFG